MKNLTINYTKIKLNNCIYPTKTEYMHDGCIKYKTSELTTETAGKIQNKMICITIVMGNYKRFPIKSKEMDLKLPYTLLVEIVAYSLQLSWCCSFSFKSLYLYP